MADAARRSAGAENSENGGDTRVDELSFEAAMERLVSLVDRLEGSDLELEEALAAFEQGVRLSGRCAAQLEEAERRIEVLMRDGDRWIARPFEGNGSFEADASLADDVEEEGT